jgi:putative aminopeptidase FrvX
MDKLDYSTLSDLTQIAGISGREFSVSKAIEAALPPSFKTIYDNIGNLIATNEGSGPSVMLVAHMDEVGLIVRRITPDGFLLVERIGGMGIRGLPGSRLRLWSEELNFLAQVGIPPQHLDASVPNPAQLYIDIGASSKEEVLEMGVQIGDMLTWDSPFEEIGAHRIRGKAFDDRLGCFALISLAKAIERDKVNLGCNLILAFTVQEETMLAGASPIVNRFHPNLVIGIDGTLPSDTPDVNTHNSEITLGGGPALKYFDAVRGKLAAYVPDWELTQLIKKIARQHSLLLQYEIVVGLTTALTPLPFALCGIKSAALSIPVRYHHSPVEMADKRDIDILLDLLITLLKDERLIALADGKSQP